jgi:hypothetical protein
LPYLNAADEMRTMYKRNEHSRETDEAKISQKKLEIAFGSSIFLDTGIFLNEWGDLVRNKDQTLTVPVDNVLHEIFDLLADFGNSINADFDTAPIVGKILVPKLKKPQSLRLAFNAERTNRSSLEYVYHYLMSSNLSVPNELSIS